MSLANKLKYLMAQLEITASDIALNTNIERSTLTRILNGTTVHPQLETVYTLAKYFKVDTQELLDNSFENDLKISDIQIIANKSTKDVLSHLMIKTGVLSTTLLHKYTGVPFSVLSEILSGKTEKPSMKTLKVLANFFNLSVAQLMGLEEIPPYKIAEINPAKNALPILEISQTEQWLSGELKIVESYLNLTRQLIGNKSFSVMIPDARFDPEFTKNNLLIIDNEAKPKTKDFIIGRFNKKVTSIYEFTDKNEIFIREAGKYEIVHITNMKQLNIFGVVIQQIINRKQ